MNSIKLFEGQEVQVKTDEGNTLINLVHVAKGCGLVDISKGTQKIMWSRLKGKLTNNIMPSSDKVVADEISYTLEEIENTDDRNTIYISSWLAKRLAIECHSDKANKFKNFLVTLDENRESGKLVPQVNAEQLEYLANNMAIIGQAVQGLQQFTMGLKEYVQDSIQAKDKQIDDIAEMIGLKNKHTRRLTEKLKQFLAVKYKIKNIHSRMEVYQKAKDKIFKEFNVTKWEDIPVGKYSTVEAFIDECL